MLIYSVIDVESSSCLTQSDLRVGGFMLYGRQPLSAEATTAGNTIVALAWLLNVRLHHSYLVHNLQAVLLHRPNTGIIGHVSIARFV